MFSFVILKTPIVGLFINDCFMQRKAGHLPGQTRDPRPVLQVLGPQTAYHLCALAGAMDLSVFFSFHTVR